MTASQDRLPVVIVTGFLGSGKTQWLRQALSGDAAGQTAVLVNEMGETRLDHELLCVAAEGTAAVLAGGCACCVQLEGFAAAMRSFVQRRARGEGIARVVVETSGLAQPAALLQTLASDPLLSQHTRVASVVTTVDGEHGAAQLRSRAAAQPRRDCQPAGMCARRRAHQGRPG